MSCLECGFGWIQGIFVLRGDVDAATSTGILGCLAD